MRYNYLTNQYEESSLSVSAILTRHRRARLMVRSGRWSEDKAVAYCLRDYSLTLYRKYREASLL